ncbi:hypothetical protein CR513_33262, partial [Mucuna pruriens]
MEFGKISPQLPSLSLTSGLVEATTKELKEDSKDIETPTLEGSMTREKLKRTHEDVQHKLVILKGQERLSCLIMQPFNKLDFGKSFIINKIRQNRGQVALINTWTFHNSPSLFSPSRPPKSPLENLQYRNRTAQATPNIMYQPWCIRYPKWEQAQSYEHKSGLTHLLPEFHGLVGNTQQFGIRGSSTSKIVNEVVVVDNQRLENKIIELTSLVRQLAIGQHHRIPPVRVCGMRASVEHPTNRYQPPPQFRPQQPMQHVEKSSLEELVKQIATNNIQFQENVFATIQDLQTHIGPLATMVNQLQSKAVIDFPDVIGVVAMQPPLPSMVQPLHAPVVTANKLQVKQNEEWLQDLKKLRDFYEHLVKHSTLRFLLKKPPEDVALELSRWMRRRLPQAITNRSRAKIFFLFCSECKSSSVGDSNRLELIILYFPYAISIVISSFARLAIVYHLNSAIQVLIDSIVKLLGEVAFSWFSFKNLRNQSIAIEFFTPVFEEILDYEIDCDLRKIFMRSSDELNNYSPKSKHMMKQMAKLEKQLAKLEKQLAKVGRGLEAVRSKRSVRKDRESEEPQRYRRVGRQDEEPYKERRQEEEPQRRYEQEPDNVINQLPNITQSNTSSEITIMKTGQELERKEHNRNCIRKD